jgi:hypothetical protein
MVGGMFAPEVTPPEGSRENRREYGRIVVVGGGCYGNDYVRQLVRAKRAGAIVWRTLTVVDRDRECAVVSRPEFAEAGAELVVSEWSEFFDEYLSIGADNPQSVTDDAIVPSPLMPHLMYEWLVVRARRRWPDRSVATRSFEESLPVRWQRLADDGTRYASFADWICPVHCIEPRVCPHTRADRDWSFPDTMKAFVQGSAGRTPPLIGPVIFHCVHRAYGVGMFDTSAVIEGDSVVASGAAQGSADVVVGTVSHCHAALNILSIREAARSTDADSSRRELAMIGP